MKKMYLLHILGAMGSEWVKLALLCPGLNPSGVPWPVHSGGTVKKHEISST